MFGFQGNAYDHDGQLPNKVMVTNDTSLDSYVTDANNLWSLSPPDVSTISVENTEDDDDDDIFASWDPRFEEEPTAPSKKRSGSIRPSVIQYAAPTFNSDTAYSTDIPLNEVDLSLDTYFFMECNNNSADGACNFHNHHETINDLIFGGNFLYPGSILKNEIRFTAVLRYTSLVVNVIQCRPSVPIVNLPLHVYQIPNDMLLLKTILYTHISSFSVAVKNKCIDITVVANLLTLTNAQKNNGLFSYFSSKVHKKFLEYSELNLPPCKFIDCVPNIKTVSQKYNLSLQSNFLWVDVNENEFCLSHDNISILEDPFLTIQEPHELFLRSSQSLEMLDVIDSTQSRYSYSDACFKDPIALKKKIISDMCKGTTRTTRSMLSSISNLTLVKHSEDKCCVPQEQQRTLKTPKSNDKCNASVDSGESEKNLDPSIGVYYIKRVSTITPRKDLFTVKAEWTKEEGLKVLFVKFIAPPDDLHKKCKNIFSIQPLKEEDEKEFYKVKSNKTKDLKLRISRITRRNNNCLEEKKQTVNALSEKKKRSTLLLEKDVRGLLHRGQEPTNIVLEKLGLDESYFLLTLEDGDKSKDVFEANKNSISVTNEPSNHAVCDERDSSSSNETMNFDSKISYCSNPPGCEKLSNIGAESEIDSTEEIYQRVPSSLETMLDISETTDFCDACKIDSTEEIYQRVPSSLETMLDNSETTDFCDASIEGYKVVNSICKSNEGVGPPEANDTCLVSVENSKYSESESTLCCTHSQETKKYPQSNVEKDVTNETVQVGLDTTEKYFDESSSFAPMEAAMKINLSSEPSNAVKDSTDLRNKIVSIRESKSLSQSSEKSSSNQDLNVSEKNRSLHGIETIDKNVICSDDPKICSTESGGSSGNKTKNDSVPDSPASPTCTQEEHELVCDGPNLERQIRKHVCSIYSDCTHSNANSQLGGECVFSEDSHSRCFVNYISSLKRKRESFSDCDCNGPVKRTLSVQDYLLSRSYLNRNLGKDSMLHESSCSQYQRLNKMATGNCSETDVQRNKKVYLNAKRCGHHQTLPKSKNALCQKGLECDSFSKPYLLQTITICKHCHCSIEKHGWDNKCSKIDLLKMKRNVHRNYTDPGFFDDITASNVTEEDNDALTRLIIEEDIQLYKPSERIASHDPREGRKCYTSGH